MGALFYPRKKSSYTQRHKLKVQVLVVQVVFNEDLHIE